MRGSTWTCACGHPYPAVTGVAFVCACGRVNSATTGEMLRRFSPSQRAILRGDRDTCICFGTTNDRARHADWCPVRALN